MAKRNKRHTRRKINLKLAVLFKMTRDELQTRRQTGGGQHRSKAIEHMPRGEQKRRSIEEQRD